MKDIIIIGAGTAGLTAAVYGLRAGKSVLVLEQGNYGGQIINTPRVENYPGIEQISGYEFATGLFKQAEKLGMEYRVEKVTAVKVEKDGGAALFDKVVETQTGSYRAKALILATGAKNRLLDIAGEAEYTGRGVSYCATCDGMFFRGKKVAVVGGGNTALEDAAFLSNYCGKVYIIHRRDAFRGEQKLVRELREKENVEFLLQKTVCAIEGRAALRAVTLCDTISGEESRLEINGLFIAIGQTPETEIFAGLVERDENGYIIAGEDCKTGIDGVFAAGDCRTKTVRQLTTAAADGAVAAISAAQM